MPIDEDRRVALPGTVSSRTHAGVDLGRVDPSRKIGPIVVLLKRTAEQQSEVEKLIEEQRDPRSPNLHKWLTPEQYADRFGLVEEDMSTIRSWVQSHGLSIDHSARGRNWIGFSGTARQVESALGIQIHEYRNGAEKHFANSTEVSIPAALEPVVGAFIGLDDFQMKPRYTAPNGAGHFLAPDDLATIYDIAQLYTNGIDGTGQKIAVVGESDLEPNQADITAFRTKFNLPGPAPQVVLYGADPGVTGSLDEADFDLEWSAAVARKATIIYVNSNNVEVSSIYAIDQNLAPVISRSYGVCEQEQFFLAELYQALIQQANTQGITYVASSGDAGPSNCTGWFHSPVAADEMGTNFPASIPEVTSVGGTEFNEGSGSYWNTSNTGNGASAISYIPEMAWNDSVAAGTIQATGGGPSILYLKPAWQSGLGVPADGVRDTPDIAMPASAFHDGYWGCTEGGCYPGWGGTSFAAPVFAGIVALINQSMASKGGTGQPGLGNINPELYRLASSAPSAFHDITVGNNIIPCASGTPDCTTGSYGFSAGPGYDMTTGLGSVDVAKLVNAWGTNGTQANITLQVDHSSISESGSVQLNVTVKPTTAGPLPTGVIYANLSHTATPLSNLPGELVLGSAALTSTGTTSSATLQIYGGQLNLGSNTITVTYDGNATYNSSSATTVVSVSAPTTTSAVVLSAFPSDYAVQFPPVGELPVAQGDPWRFVLELKEVAGVATNVTGFTINGDDESSQIAGLFGSTVLPANGTLGGNWQINVPSVPTTLSVVFSGQDTSGFAWTTAIQVQLVGGPEQFVRIGNGGLVNAASFQGTFAPGMILSVFGGNLNNPPSATGEAPSVPLPLTLAGSSATINGVDAPYYYASSGQVNIQIPYETAPGDAVLTITGFIGQTFSYSFKVQPSAPGIFVDPRNGAPVPSETGSPGNEVFLYITGEGLVKPALATGASPTPGTPLAQLPQPQLPVSMTVANIPATIAFIGIVPGIVGATQINYIIPANAPSGPQPVVVTVGGVASPPAYITVQ